MKARAIPARIQALRPFFSTDEEGFLNSSDSISERLVGASPRDWKRGYPLGEVVGLALLKMSRCYPPEPGQQLGIDPENTALSMFMEGDAFRKAPESFRIGVLSAVEIAAQVALLSPYLAPALACVLDRLDAATLEDWALRCLMAPAPESPSDCREVEGVSHLQQLLEAEHAAMTASAASVGGQENA